MILHQNRVSNDEMDRVPLKLCQKVAGCLSFRLLRRSPCYEVIQQTGNIAAKEVKLE